MRWLVILDVPGGDLDARHLLEGGGEAPLARGDHPHVVGQGRRHLVQPERGEVDLARSIARHSRGLGDLS